MSMTTKKATRHGIEMTEAQTRLHDAANAARLEADKAKERQVQLEHACKVIEGVQMMRFASEEARVAAIENLVQGVLGA